MRSQRLSRSSRSHRRIMNAPLLLRTVWPTDRPMLGSGSRGAAPTEVIEVTQSKIAAIAFASSLLGLAAAPADSSGQVVKKGAPADGCGAIIDVNRTTGLVTARVNATG